MENIYEQAVPLRLASPQTEDDTERARLASPTPRYNLEEIHRTIDLLLEPGQVYEVRAFGYFDDFEKLAQATAGLNGRVLAVDLAKEIVAYLDGQP